MSPWAKIAGLGPVVSLLMLASSRRLASLLGSHVGGSAPDGALFNQAQGHWQRSRDPPRPLVLGRVHNVSVTWLQRDWPIECGCSV